MKLLSSTFLALTLLVLTPAAFFLPSARAETAAPKAKASPTPSGKEVTLKGQLGCGKCSFHEAKACQNVLKVKDAAGKETSYQLADNEVARANHEKVCGPASPATVTGTVTEKDGKKVLTASAVIFDS